MNNIKINIDDFSNHIHYLGTVKNVNHICPKKGDMIYDQDKQEYLVYGMNEKLNWTKIANYSCDIMYSKEELINPNCKDTYMILYERLCKDYPNKVNEFYSLLKLYEKDYEKTCYAIFYNLGNKK